MQELLRERKLSATAVAEELGFKNRTAFFRILHDESRISGVQRCFEAAKQSALLSLSAEEIDRLSAAVSVSELGKKTYGIHTAMREMIYPGMPMPPEPIALEGETNCATLGELMRTLNDLKSVTIVIMGRCTRDVMDRLFALTKETTVRKIIHVFAFDEEDPEDIKIFATMANLLFSSVYSVFCLNETGVTTKNWWMRSGTMLFNCERADGTRLGFQMTPVEKNCYLYSEEDPDKLKAFWNAMMSHVKERVFPLKREDEGRQVDLKSYIEFTKTFEQLERNRELYMIKPDFPINCVPPEILEKLARDAFAQAFPGDEEEFKTLIEQIYEIHAARVKNMYHKRRVTHIVLNEDAMECFARTGNRSDHLFLCRPYTPQERVSMLTLLRDQTRDNPYFNVWIGTDEGIVNDRELKVYDGHGVSLIKADTSWQLHGEQQNVMLESKLLASYFKSYIVGSVIAKGVRSQQESIAVLDRLIEIAKQS